jgi:hypothetical protein
MLISANTKEGFGIIISFIRSLKVAVQGRTKEKGS